MASDYGNNFGFRVSDESRRSSMGRVKTPATGAVLLQGTAVEIDPAVAGYLKQSVSGVKPRTGTAGLLVQEESWNSSIYEAEGFDSFSLGVTKKNTLSVITNGPGTKVWFRNTAAQTRADGRSITAVTMFVATGVAVGRGWIWNGTAWADGGADPTIATSYGEVVYYDAARGYVEVMLSH